MKGIMFLIRVSGIGGVSRWLCFPGYGRIVHPLIDYMAKGVRPDKVYLDGFVRAARMADEESPDMMPLRYTQAGAGWVGSSIASVSSSR